MPRKNPATGDPILDCLRAERERRHWSQQALAQRIGRQTYQTIWQWESGTTEPTLSSLREWANALGYGIALLPADAYTEEEYQHGTEQRTVWVGPWQPVEDTDDAP